MIISLISLGLIGGVALSRLGLPVLPFIVLAAVLGGFWFIFRKRYHLLLGLSLGVLAISGGILLAGSQLNTNSDPSQLSYYNDSGKLELKGIITQNPDNRDRTSLIVLNVSSIATPDGWQGVSGNILLTLPSYPEYHYGEEIQINGYLKTPENFEGFDYKAYLANQQIYSVMVYPEITLLSEGNGNPLMAAIFSLRQNLSESLSRAIPEPESSLAKGILLGERSGIPEDIQTEFSISGTTHLLAISGANLSILSGILLTALGWVLGKRGYIYIYLTLILIWGYSLLSGFDPPVVRAVIMASIFLAAELLGRQKNALPALCLAAAVMVAFTPSILWSVSFQLSFMSMLGLILVYPMLKELNLRLLERFGLSEGTLRTALGMLLDGLGVSLAAIAGIWPVLLYYFENISLIGPVATLLAMPAMPFIIVLSFLTALVGLVFPAGAVFMGYLTWLPCRYMLTVVSLTASLPGVLLAGIRPGAILMGIYYFLLGVLYRAYKHFLKIPARSHANPSSAIKLRWVLAGIAVPVLVFSFGLNPSADQKMHVYFLDVGQGDAILIQYQNQDILIDGGPSPQALCNELDKHLPFFDRNIEMVILTHPDSDHLSGLLEVLERYSVTEVLLPQTQSQDALYQNYQNMIEEKAIPARTAQTGMQITLANGAVLEVISPFEGLTSKEADRDNNQSTVLTLSYGQINYLFCADIETATEYQLITRRLLENTTVLKVAHHGSKYSSGTEFLNVTLPVFGLISAGADNRYGHPHPETLSRLSLVMAENHIYRTDIWGSLDFATDGQSLYIFQP
ncbi:competence protein ComEC [Dehalococcoides mccartyi]|uniref:Competence protein ComEC n=1 Tax=Dehalococcoides mccartyi TaxID=61435 RepID=A0A0V8LXR2_9CHLR|nr:DNA internalization-related competence protein ComEC/Rec2 [Dehalococcoides mccartyi]KSV16291.1 competence protein ComEC [Dehalococcoides mccartyi]